MANYYVLLTDHGKSFIANAQANSQLALTHVVLGDANGQPYLPESRLNQTTLVHQTAKLPVASVKVINDTTAEVSAIVPSNVGGFNVHEVGITDSSGKLVYVGNFHGGYRPTLTEGAGGDMELIVTIKAENLATVVIEMDGNVVSATRDWVNERFQFLLQTLIPYGYQYDTHTATNPKPMFDELLGIATYWRRITGKLMLATDPNDDAIKDHSVILGQLGMTELANAQRAHVYPLQTSHKFERYDPAAVIETVWRVTANKTSINEGDTVRFTVTANNLPDGQILNWTVKEGALNTSSNDITAPEKTESGTVILRNGQAIVDFTTTPDDNAEESQKHVRLTVGAPADLSINIPIDDTGHYETVIHVSESTTNGIDLAEYYNTQSGSYPSATETVRFIVDAGVDIIAPNTTTPAITEGANWPSEASAIVENHGRILGRGGDGGVPADYYLTRINNEGNFVNLVYSQSQRGGDGGTAVKGDMTVDNYGIIAGGGGGGGGAGFFRVSNESTGHIFIDQCHGGGAGGGAPLGRRYPNAKTYEQYWEKFEQSAPKYVFGVPENGSLQYDAWTDLSIFGKDDGAEGSMRGVIFSGNPLKSSLLKIGDAYQNDLSTGRFSYVIPRYIDETETNYKVASWGDYPYAWIDMGMRQPTHATIEEGGVGGINLYGSDGGTYALNNLARSALNLDLSKNKGGDGGAIGENGEASLLGEFFSVGSGVQISSKRVTKSELLSIEEPNVGGLAGFVKEGGVTINNYSGVTKGR